MRVVQIPEWRENLSKLEFASRQHEVADLSALGQNHHRVSSRRNEDFLGAAGYQRRQVVRSGDFLFAFPHERALALVKRGRHQIGFTAGLERNDQLARSGVPISNVRDRHAGRADGDSGSCLRIDLDDLTPLRLARGVVWRDEHELAICRAEDDFLFAFVDRGRRDAGGDSEVERLFLCRPRFVIDDQDRAVWLDEERLRAPFVDAEEGVFGIRELDAFEWLHFGGGEKRPDLKEDKDENAQHRGDDQSPSKFDKNRHETIDDQSQLGRLEAALASGMLG